MSENDYERYHGTWNKQHFGPIFHSVIVLPTLIYALSQMIEDETGDNYGDRKWYQVLDHRIKNDEALEIFTVTANCNVKRVFTTNFRRCLRDDFSRTTGINHAVYCTF